MIDQNSQFMAILTNVGAAKLANANALGLPWKLTALGVGDANGTDPVPNATQTKLINECRRAPLNQLTLDPVNPAVIIAEQVIPADVGGWWIREIGLYDEEGDLVAVSNCAPSFKPVLSQGSGRTQIVRMNFIVSSITNVVLKIDPAIVLATRDHVDRSIDAVLPGNKAPGTYHQVTINKHGIVVAGSNPTTLKGHGIDDAVSSTPQFGTSGAIADLTKTTFGTYTSETTDKPPSSGWGVFLRIKYPGANAALDIAGDVAGGMDTLSFRRVLPNGSYAWRTVFHDGNFDPALKANLASPNFTGIPTAPTAPPGSNFGELANAAFVWGAVNTYATTVSQALATKANLASPAFTGIPTVPTAVRGTSSPQVASTAFVVAEVMAEVAKLVGSAPESLNAVYELAAAIGNDPNFAISMNNLIATKATKGATLAAYGILDSYRAVDVDYRLSAKANWGTSLASYGILDAIRNHNPLPGESIDIHGGTYAFLSAPLESTVAQNCYWNGKDWVRHETTKSAVCISASNGVAHIRTALPGAGPIAWATSDPLWTSSNATVSSSAGTGTLKLPNGWIQQVFDVTESLHANDLRYFPVSFPNECFGVFPSLTSATAGGYANNSGLCVGDVTKDRFVISAGGNFSSEGRFRVLAIGR